MYNNDNEVLALAEMDLDSAYPVESITDIAAPLYGGQGYGLVQFADEDKDFDDHEEEDDDFEDDDDLDDDFDEDEEDDDEDDDDLDDDNADY
jgi:hypothetical protein